MKLKNILFLMLVMVLASCGHYKDGTSVYAEWGWVPLVILGAGFILFSIVTWWGYRSGTHHQSQVGDGGAGGWKEDKGKKINIGYLVIALGFLAGLIWYIIDKNSSI